MPSATSVSGFDLVNLGPLTTTFTAPPECTLPVRGVALGMPYAEVPFGYWSEVCTTRSAGSCFPSGAAADEDTSTRTSGVYRGEPLYYFSPANACPSGWTTAGTATRTREGDPLLFDGVFNPGFVEISGSTSTIYNPAPNVWMNALEPGETGIACCPSGYTGGGSPLCYSIFPATDYPFTTACGMENTNWPPGEYIPASFLLGNQSVTGIVLNWTTTLDLVSSTTTFSPNALPTEDIEIPWAGIASESMIFLAYGGSPVSNAAPQSTAESDGGGTPALIGDGTVSSTDAGAAASSTDSAAMRSRCGFWYLAIGLAASAFLSR